jgi:hypothetical protein
MIHTAHNSDQNDIQDLKKSWNGLALAHYYVGCGDDILALMGLLNTLPNIMGNSLTIPQYVTSFGDLLTCFSWVERCVGFIPHDMYYGMWSMDI